LSGSERKGKKGLSDKHLRAQKVGGETQSFPESPSYESGPKGEEKGKTPRNRVPEVKQATKQDGVTYFSGPRSKKKGA